MPCNSSISHQVQQSKRPQNGPDGDTRIRAPRRGERIGKIIAPFLGAGNLRMQIARDRVVLGLVVAEKESQTALDAEEFDSPPRMSGIRIESGTQSLPIGIPFRAGLKGDRSERQAAAFQEFALRLLNRRPIRRLKLSSPLMRHCSPTGPASANRAIPAKVPSAPSRSPADHA